MKLKTFGEILKYTCNKHKFKISLDLGEDMLAIHNLDDISSEIFNMVHHESKSNLSLKEFMLSEIKEFYLVNGELENEVDNLIKKLRGAI